MQKTAVIGAICNEQEYRFLRSDIFYLSGGNSIKPNGQVNPRFFAALFSLLALYSALWTRFPFYALHVVFLGGVGAYERISSSPA